MKPFPPISESVVAAALTTIAVLAPGSPAHGEDEAAKPQPPNIVYIMAEVNDGPWASLAEFGVVGGN